MKKILLTAVILLLSTSAIASTPITCTALAALGYNYVYFGFTGTGPDVFAMAGSNNGASWTNIPATWPTCGNGTPCQPNSPSAVCYNDHVYLLMAEAHDGGLNSSFQDIGVLNDDYSVTTLLTFDWSSIGSVSTIFAGRWLSVPGYTNCFVTPVTFTGGYYSWSTYYACASLSPTSASITSGPTLLTTTGVTTGYDPQIIQAGSICYLVQTKTASGLPYRITEISSGSCPSGPFTYQADASVPSGPLYPQQSVSTQAEGPNYIHTNIAGGWYFWFEDISTHQMYYSNCTPIDPTSCTISAPAAWTQDMTYRAGTILSFFPLPATTITGGTLNGGTVQ